MSFTDIGSGAGLVYDVDENLRLNDLANRLNESTDKAELEDLKKKDAIRYTIISVGAVFILVALQFLVKKRK